MNKNSLIPISLAASIVVFSVTIAYNASAKITTIERDLHNHDKVVEAQIDNMNKAMQQLYKLNETVARNTAILEEIKRKVK